MLVPPDLTLDIDWRGYLLGADATHRWLAVPQLVNWRLIGVRRDAKPADGFDYGWCYDSRTSLIVSVTLWFPEVHDEPFFWHKRASARIRRAPQRDRQPKYNQPRCVHGTYLDAPACKHDRFCAEFAGKAGKAEH